MVEGSLFWRAFFVYINIFLKANMKRWKEFFEQYGSVALGILALPVLIAMIAPAGNIIKTSLQGTVQTFSASINSQTNDMDKQLQEAFNNAVANLSHINTPYVKGDFSTKGNLVTINGTHIE